MSVSFLFIGLAAYAESLVVLPLVRGEDSENHLGLGFGLADVVHHDLAQVPLFEMVELDPVIADLTLSRRDGVDRAKALAAASGLETDWALAGTWSVKKRTLDLTFEMVETSSGKLLARASASGAASDFVTVEKEAVMGLLDNLGMELSPGVRRRITSAVVTENFEALAEYGKGRRQFHEGDIEHALEAYERAASLNPSFDLAIRAASAARVAIEKTAMGQTDAARDTRTEILLKALSKTDSEMELTKKTRRLDPYVRLLIRFTLLDELGRHCEANTEMEHFFLRQDGRLPKASNRHFKEEVKIIAAQLGLNRKLEKANKEGDIDEPRLITAVPPNTMGALLVTRRRDTTALMNVALRCAGTSPVARLRAIEHVTKLAEGFPGAMGLPTPKGLSVDTELRLHHARERARLEGLSESLRAELDALGSLEMFIESRERMERLLGTIREEGIERSRLLDILAPFDEASLLATVQSNAKGAWTPTSPWCQAVASSRDWNLQLEMLERGIVDGYTDPDRQRLVVRGSTVARLGVLTGCIEHPSSPASILSWEDSLRWADSVLSEAQDGECTQEVSALEKSLQVARAKRGENPGVAMRLIKTGMQLGDRGCLAKGGS